MSKEPNSNERDAGRAANRESEQRRLCLDHARDLIASTERVLANDNSFPNIAYHLAILALEGIGKAGMLAARSVAKHGLDASWIDNRLDKHVEKIMWAVWSPSLVGGKLAEGFHGGAPLRREYARPTDGGPLCRPRQRQRLHTSARSRPTRTRNFDAQSCKSLP